MMHAPLDDQNDGPAAVTGNGPVAAVERALALSNNIIVVVAAVALIAACAILSYSVLHYVFVESSIWSFLDTSLDLLAHSGEMLIGDIPNISKRKRFFASPQGIAHHRAFTGNPA